MMDQEAFAEYLREYRLQPPAEPEQQYEEGELEAQWLESAGLSELTRAFHQGRELPESEIRDLLVRFSRTQAEAVGRRVRVLNRTVRGRGHRGRQRKPDIRDVFRDVETSSTGTRSRSATPDSLDSVPSEEHWAPIPNFISIFDQRHVPRPKQGLRRSPSAPLRTSSAELFRSARLAGLRGDVASDSEGIELLGFQRLGTIHLPRVRSGSDPSCTIGHEIDHMTVARSHSNLYSLGSHDLQNSSPRQTSSGEESPPQTLSISGDSPPPLSFENMCRQQNQDLGWDLQSLGVGGCDISHLSEVELKKLQPLLWLELAALFDVHRVPWDKRKPQKRKRKEEGNLFGVSLNALVRRDQQLTGEDTTLVPLLVQWVLKELKSRGVREEGILRVAGNKQKVETLCSELERDFYTRPERVAPHLSRAGPHDLSALLKKWLRELPQPLLSTELVHLFHQAYALPSGEPQATGLCLLALLLPSEHRNTLRELLNFFREIVFHSDRNKMTLHNVSMIVAPSLFPPRFIHPCDKSDLGAQVRMAAQCCQLTETLLNLGDGLWEVPANLLSQTKQMNKSSQIKRQLVRKKKVNAESHKFQ